MSTVKATKFQNASSATVNMEADTSGNVAFGNNITVAGDATVTGDITLTGGLITSSSYLRNRIINGDMRVLQRNTASSTHAKYSVDRWALGIDTTGSVSLTQSQIGPAGFTDSLILDVVTADTSLASTEYVQVYQIIEGNNISDLGWGAA